MVRNLLYVLVLLVAVTIHPQLASADEHSLVEYCPLDGHLSTSLAHSGLTVIENNEQPLTVDFAVTNNSTSYTYGGVEIGVAIYESESASIPSYWTPVVTDAEFFPGSTQTFESVLDVTHLPAGQYVLKIGVAQASQLAALANSQTADGFSFSKTVAGEPYQADLTGKQIPEKTGGVAEYELVTTNSSNSVQRDFEQHVAIVRGTVPAGSAVLSSLSESVKMIPSSQEKTASNIIIQTDGSYTALGYFTKQNTLLPVVSDRFVVGTGDGPNDVYVTGVGVSSLDQANEVIEIISCVAATVDQTFDVAHLTQRVTREGETVTMDTAEVGENGFVRSVIKKDNLTEFTVDSKLYITPNQIDFDSEAAEEEELELGILAQSISQTYACIDQCQPSGIGQTLESFVTEDVVRSTFWFYLGIILAAALLLLLMLGRLPTPEEEHEPMHEPQ